MKQTADKMANRLYPDNTFAYKGFMDGAKWVMEKYRWKSIEKDGYPKYDPEEEQIFLVRYVQSILEDEIIRLHTDRLCRRDKFTLEVFEDMKATHYMEIPSFDEIIEDNKDVLKRLKDK